MSAVPPHPDSGGTTDRVRCAYCGGNNFPSSPACWQCGRPLRPLSVNAAAGTAAPPPSIGTAPPSSGSAAPAWSPAQHSSPLSNVDPGLAPRAAAALGIMFPWAGLPIGIAFLMLDDARKAKLGWIAIGWSVAGTILNVLLFVLPLLGLLPELKALLSHPGGLPGGAGGGAPGGGGLGLPSLGGDGP